MWSFMKESGLAGSVASILRRVAGWLLKSLTGIALLPLLGASVVVVADKAALILFTPAIRNRIFHSPTVGPQFIEAHTVSNLISLLRSDLLLCFVVLPVLVCLLTAWMRLRWRIVVASFVAPLIHFVVITETLSYLVTNAFSSWASLLVSLSWEVFVEPWQITSHRVLVSLTVADLVCLMLLGAFAIVAARRKMRWLNNLCLSVVAGAAVVWAVTGFWAKPASGWSQSLLGVSTASMLSGSSADFALDSKSDQDLVRDYRGYTGSLTPHETALTGKAKNYNVLFFVLESINADGIDPARDSLDDMPHLRELRSSSFVLRRHYTTYPLTDNAMFSMMTSMLVRKEGDILSRSTELPGAIRTLRQAGYATGFYGFIWHDVVKDDLPLIQSLGFDVVANPPFSRNDSLNMFAGPLDKAGAVDHDALVKLKSSIHDWTGHGQRFAAAFFPEVAHDPYRTMNGKPWTTAAAAAHDLAVYQDAWLGELMEELRRDGALDNTILVFTSDHGMRWTRSLDPHGNYSVFHSTLDEAMLRVPAMIYVPGVLKGATAIDGPTSHIDIAPTVLDLLGIRDGRELEEGMPVYDAEIGKRVLFLQMQQFGAAGYYAGGIYHSRDALGEVFESATLAFQSSDHLPYGSGEARRVRALMELQEANEDALLHRVTSRR